MARAFIGTSGWHYPHWRGPFYPEDLPASRWLGHYAARFDTVELNNCFYRLPSTGTVKAWYEATPERFVFAVKASRYITHVKRLREAASFTRLFERVKEFSDKLGPVLFQLPPRWHPDCARLEAFLAALPPRLRCAFEFRDPTWHNDEVYRLLDRHNAAFCIYDLAGFTAPSIVTADFVYVRLHGPGGKYRGDYPRRTLTAWARAVDAWLAGGRDAFVYFDNDEAGYAAANALTLKRLVGHPRKRAPLHR